MGILVIDDVENKMKKYIIIMHENHEDSIKPQDFLDKYVLQLNIGKFKEFVKYLTTEYNGTFFVEINNFIDFGDLKEYYQSTKSLLSNIAQSLDTEVYERYVYSVDDRFYISGHCLYNSILITNRLKLHYENFMSENDPKFYSSFHSFDIKDLYTVFNIFFLKFTRYTKIIDDEMILSEDEAYFMFSRELMLEDFVKYGGTKFNYKFIGSLAGEIYLLLKSILYFQKNLISEDCLAFILQNGYGIMYVSNFIKTLRDSNCEKILFSYAHPRPFSEYSAYTTPFLQNFSQAEDSIVRFVKSNKNIDTVFYNAGGAHCETLKRLLYKAYNNNNIKYFEISTFAEKNILKFFISTGMFGQKTKQQQNTFLEKYMSAFNYEKSFKYITNSHVSKKTKHYEDFSNKHYGPRFNSERPAKGEPKSIFVKNDENLNDKKFSDVLEAELLVIKSNNKNILDIALSTRFVKVKKVVNLKKDDRNFLSKHFETLLIHKENPLIDLVYDLDLFTEKYAQNQRGLFLNNVLTYKMNIVDTEFLRDKNEMPDKICAKIKQDYFNIFAKYYNQIRAEETFTFFEESGEPWEYTYSKLFKKPYSF